MTMQIANQGTKTGVIRAALFADIYFATGEDKSGEQKAKKFITSLHHFKHHQSLAYWRQESPDEAYAQDAVVVQLVCNEPLTNRAAVDSWREMLASLETAFRDTFSSDIFGYTLTYQAVIRNSTDSNKSFADLLTTINLNQLLEACKRPAAEPSQEVLAETVVLEEQGKVWLLDVPNVHQPTRGDHLEKGMVYLALSLESANDAIVSQVIYGKSALLFMPNLVAHKGYNQIRQYRLYNQQQDIRSQLTTIVYDAKQQLKNIKTITLLNRLHISLNRQIYNYGASSKYDVSSKGLQNKVLAFHAAQLEAPLKEMELMIEEAGHVQRATDTAVLIMQTEVQEKFGTILAIIGVGLGISQVVDKSAADALLRLCSPYLAFVPMLAVNESYDRLLTLGVQLGIIILAVMVLTPLVFWLSNRYVGWKRGKMG